MNFPLFLGYKHNFMAYNEKLADRLREMLAELPDVEEKKMFRGVTFMVNGKMCVSVSGENLMCRIGADMHDVAVEQNGCSEVVMRGRVMKDFMYVSGDAVKSKKELAYWVDLLDW